MPALQAVGLDSRRLVERAVEASGRPWGRGECTLTLHTTGPKGLARVEVYAEVRDPASGQGETVGGIALRADVFAQVFAHGVWALAHRERFLGGTEFTHHLLQDQRFVATDFAHVVKGAVTESLGFSTGLGAAEARLTPGEAGDEEQYHQHGTGGNRDFNTCHSARPVSIQGEDHGVWGSPLPALPRCPIL